MTDRPTPDAAQPSGETGRSDLSQRATTIALTAILLVAVALRLYGLNWDQGFGWTPHPDERAILFKVIEIEPPGLGDLSVLLDAEQSPWNPQWFPYGSFPLYLLKVVDILRSSLPGLGPDDLRVPARAVSALADIATILIAYLIGKALWSRKVGVLAAGLIAFSVIHIQLSHFFAVDTLMALFATATLYFLIRVARWGRYSDSAFAGLCIGLGLATNVSVAPILAAYVVAHFIFAAGLAPNSPGSSNVDLRSGVRRYQGGCSWSGQWWSEPSWQSSRTPSWTGVASTLISSSSPRWCAGFGTIHTRAST